MRSLKLLHFGHLLLIRLTITIIITKIKIIGKQITKNGKPQKVFLNDEELIIEEASLLSE